MKAAIAVAALLTPALAAAQAFPSGGPQAGMVLAPPTGNFNTATEGRFFERVADTSTMQREKRDRALALHAEAEELLRQDGGTLTRAHQAYIQRKARDILDYPN